jgi:hypothetical protein
MSESTEKSLSILGHATNILSYFWIPRSILSTFLGLKWLIYICRYLPMPFPLQIHQEVILITHSLAGDCFQRTSPQSKEDKIAKLTPQLDYEKKRTAELPEKLLSRISNKASERERYMAEKGREREDRQPALNGERGTYSRPASVPYRSEVSRS